MGQEASSHHIKFLNSIFKGLRETPANDDGQRKSWYSVYSPCRKAGCVLLTDILDQHCIGSSCQPLCPFPGQGYLSHLETSGKSFLDLGLIVPLTHMSVWKQLELPVLWLWMKPWWHLEFRHLILCVGGPCFILTILPALYRLLPTLWVQTYSLLHKCLLKYLSLKVWYPCNSSQKKKHISIFAPNGSIQMW